MDPQVAGWTQDWPRCFQKPTSESEMGPLPLETKKSPRRCVESEGRVWAHGTYALSSSGAGALDCCGKKRSQAFDLAWCVAICFASREMFLQRSSHLLTGKNRIAARSPPTYTRTTTWKLTAKTCRTYKSWLRRREGDASSRWLTHRHKLESLTLTDFQWFTPAGKRGTIILRRRTHPKLTGWFQVFAKQ